MTVPRNLGDGSIGEDALAIGLYCTLVTSDLKDGVVLPANGTFLRSFSADIFFNDQMRLCDQRPTSPRPSMVTTRSRTRQLSDRSIFKRIKKRLTRHKIAALIQDLPTGLSADSV